MPETGTQTGLQAQSYPSSYVREIFPKKTVSFSYYRTQRRHPTIAFARKMAITPIVDASWSIDAPDASDSAIIMAQAVIDNLRTRYVDNMLRNLYDYGFGAFEQYLDGDAMLAIKPLLADNVTARVDQNGEFAGIVVRSLLSGYATAARVVLDPDECIFMGLDAEAGMLYGEGYLENARRVYQAWEESDKAAKRYDQKIAGSFLVVYYPTGETVDNSGTKRDNFEIAKDILAAMESSGTAALANDTETFLAGANRDLPGPEWRIEFLSDSATRQGSFIERQRYLDGLMVRAFMLPERAILEGQFGTLAEAMAHQNLALASMEMVHKQITHEFERQALRPYLSLMLGQEQAEKVTLACGPINKDATLWKRSLVERLISLRPTVVDLDALMDEVGLVKAEEIIEPTNTPPQENANNGPESDSNAAAVAE